jgi:competence ComEA-like helix-hairpin-helix protein
MRCRKRAALAALAFGVLVGAQEKQSALPDGAGKDVVQKLCSSCHEVEAVIASRRTRIGWERNVDDMISRGAEGSDEDMSLVVEYLTRYFGKLNVNTATTADMEKSLNLSAKEAQAIAEYRERNGKIKDFEELKKVPGVSAEKLLSKRGLIAFTL